MDNTGSLRAGNGRNGAKARAPKMSYQYRAGQVEQQLAISSPVTIGDLACLLGMSRRQIWDITNRMAAEGRIGVTQVPYNRTTFKHIISRRQP